MYFSKSSRPAQVAGAYNTFRPLVIAFLRGHTSSALLAPLTPARGALASPGTIAGPACGQSVAANRGLHFYAPVPDLPRLLSPAGSEGSREAMMQRNGVRPAEDDYPYELQLQLFGNHLLSLAEEAGRFDFRGTYTPAEVAGILRVAPSKIYELLHTGELPSVRIGRQFRVGKFSLWCYLNSLDREGLVEEILDRFVVQHCCREEGCEVRP